MTVLTESERKSHISDLSPEQGRGEGKSSSGRTSSEISLILDGDFLSLADVTQMAKKKN